MSSLIAPKREKEGSREGREERYRVSPLTRNGPLLQHPKFIRLAGLSPTTEGQLLAGKAREKREYLWKGTAPGSRSLQREQIGGQRKINGKKRYPQSERSGADGHGPTLCPRRAMISALEEGLGWEWELGSCGGVWGGSGCQLSRWKRRPGEMQGIGAYVGPQRRQVTFGLEWQKIKGDTFSGPMTKQDAGEET